MGDIWLSNDVVRDNICLEWDISRSPGGLPVQQFYLPQSLRHQPTRIVEVDGLAFLSVLGDGAFCIDPRRWHRIKTYIAKGTVEYPQVSVRDSGVSDGRHRTLLLMQLYNRRTIPVVVPESHYGTFMTEAKNMGAI